jgi:hypothetical protein
MVAWLKSLFCRHTLIAEPARGNLDALFYVTRQQIESHHPFRWPAIRERFRCTVCGTEKWV